MEKHHRSSGRKTSVAQVSPRFQDLRNPEIDAYLERLRRLYHKHLVPIEDIQDMMDKVLGEESITDELFRMRGCVEELARKKES